jgi:alkanesulfonate monooxygenase SsuD/methylene tetrahydromethanopterin reductase-like flavin-dependent oxidoreductase (luciferase family)
VRYGLALPTGGECGDPRFLVELAELAEAVGWEGVFLEDYIGYQGQVTPTSDVWTALAAIAVRTTDVLLATCVTPLARRRPWRVAHEAVGIDHLSGGRFVLGVGLGDANDPGFGRVGETTAPKRRAALLDEGLEIVAGLWSGEPFAFRGEHFVVEELTLLPRPVQHPRIPIWVGGGYPNSGPTARAARWDGSMMYREKTHDLAPVDVRRLRELAGDRPYTVCLGGRERWDDWEAEREWRRGVADAGAAWWAEFFPAADRETLRAKVARGPLRID